jgi:hypothetical protein
MLLRTQCWNERLQSMVCCGRAGARAAIGEHALDDALVEAAILGDAEGVDMLLQLGANPNAQDGHAVYTTAIDSDDRCLALLLKAGAKPCASWDVAIEQARRKGYNNVVDMMQTVMNM